MMNSAVSNLLAQPTKTSDDLQKILDQWHESFVANEHRLIEHAEKCDQRQEMLNETTAALIENQNCLSEIDRDLDEFRLNIDALTKYNDELEKSIEQLNSESKTYLPTFLGNVKTEQDRKCTYELLESVDGDLNELEKQMSRLDQILRMDSDQSIVKTMEELQTCSRDIQQLHDSIRQLKCDDK